MKDKIKMDLCDTEKNLIIKSLTMFRNYLTAQDRSTDSVDEIILKISDKRKIELDTFDAGIVINALNTMRYKLKNENQPRTDVNDILLKMIDETDKKKLILRKHTRDNGRRF